MLPREIKQRCLKCKGTGVSDKVLTDRDGNVVLADTYTKGDGNRPQYENCSACGGEGMTLQKPPESIKVDGEVIKLTPKEAQERYAVSA
jgi:hypothetical protein